jgi:nucleotide-binding universal stress UspA family protein
MLTMAAEVVSTNPLNITAIGVIIAIVFLTSIVGVLGWMLRLPKETERTRTATKAVRSVNQITRILVPLLRRSEATDRIVALAAQMARQRNGHVDILAVIEVPFTLPLNARVEEEEKLALEALDRAQSVAAQCGTRNGTTVSKRILKARNAGTAIVREAEDSGVDLILMANTPVRVRGNVQQVDPVVEYVMKNAPCEVLVLSQSYANAPLNGAGTNHREEQIMTAGANR